MKLIRTRLLLPLLAALFLTVGLTACGSSSQPAPTDTSADVVGIYRLQHISAAGLDLDADALSETMGTLFRRGPDPGAERPEPGI